MKELWLPDKSIHLPSPTKLELGKVPLLGALVEIGAWDRQGKLYHQVREPSRSPVLAFIELLLVQMQPSVSQTIKDPLDADHTIAERAQNFNIEAAINVDTRGIIIGTDATAVDILNNKLIALIEDGTASGEMIYQVQQFDATVTIADPDATFDVWRNYNNNSGGTITVRETGIASDMVDSVGAIKKALLIRDTPSSVAVSDGGGCYVKYTLKITE